MPTCRGSMYGATILTEVRKSIYITNEIKCYIITGWPQKSQNKIPGVFQVFPGSIRKIPGYYIGYILPRNGTLNTGAGNRCSKFRISKSELVLNMDVIQISQQHVSQ